MTTTVVSTHPASSAVERGQTRAASTRWWAHLAWVAATAVLGFSVPAFFVGILHWPRTWFVVPYAILSLAFLALYVRWSGVDVYRRARQHWAWGVVGAILAGAVVVMNVFAQQASVAPAGPELIGALLLLGVVYGTVDALLLSILPLFAAWQALAAVGWTHGWGGRALSGVLAMIASLAVAAVYHLGYPEFRNPGVVAPIIGNGILSLASLLAMNPIAAVVGHIAMHVAAVLHGMETTVQLPPHY